MTLSDLVPYLSSKFPQEEITSDIFDFEKAKEVKGKVPKYFYRGESNLYKDTKTTLARLINEKKLNQYEWYEYMSIHFHLYLFLKEALWGISVVEDKDHKNPFIEQAIAGMLQHYGFDTSFLDLTSDINVAAYFSSMNSIGEKGKILVINSESLNSDSFNYYFDLTRCPGKRPQSQKSFVIWDQFGQLNLKDESFLKKQKGQWFEFEIDKLCKSIYRFDSLLTTETDEIVSEINDWWNYSDVKNKYRSTKVFNLIGDKIKKLNQKNA